MRLLLTKIGEFVSLFVKLASRIDDAKKKFPDLDIETIAGNDPSGSQKYLLWMANQIANGQQEDETYEATKLFHTNRNRLKIKDIYQYKKLSQLQEAINALPVSKRKQRKKIKSDAVKIYEDEDYVVIRPDTKEAAMQYGKNTQWCITQQDEANWEQYEQSNIVHYFVMSKDVMDDAYDKMAMSFGRDANNKITSLEITNMIDDAILSVNATHGMPEGRPADKFSDALSQEIINEGNALENVFDNPDTLNKIIDVTTKDAEARPRQLLARLWDEVNPLSQEELLGAYTDLTKYTYGGDVNKAGDDALAANRLRENLVEVMLPETALHAMNDRFWGTRIQVAKKIDIKHLNKMMDDPEEEVLYTIMERSPEVATHFLQDERKRASIEVDRIIPLLNPSVFETKEGLQALMGTEFEDLYPRLVVLAVNRMSAKAALEFLTMLRYSGDGEDFHKYDYILEEDDVIKSFTQKLGGFPGLVNIFMKKDVWMARTIVKLLRLSFPRSAEQLVEVVKQLDKLGDDKRIHLLNFYFPNLKSLVQTTTEPSYIGLLGQQPQRDPEQDPELDKIIEELD